MSDDTRANEYNMRKCNRSFKLLRRTNSSYEMAEDLREEEMAVSERMTAKADVGEVLSDTGMRIEEKDLEDVIILDPIEYLVKPATTIICKHLEIKNQVCGEIEKADGELESDKIGIRYYPHLSDTGVTINSNERATTQREGKKHIDEDRMMMLEYGRLSEMALNDIWARYHPHLSDAGIRINSEKDLDNVLLMIIRFGLLFIPPITSLNNSGNSNSNIYYIPSLLPSDSPTRDCFDNYGSDGSDSKENKEHMFKVKQSARQKLPNKSWNVGMHFSLFFYPLIEGFPNPQCFGELIISFSSAELLLHYIGYDVIPSSELTKNGFLPLGFFERFIFYFKQRLDQQVRLRDVVDSVGGKATLTFPFLDIFIIEKKEEKRIEIILRTHPDADREKAKKVFQDLYYIMLDVIDGVRKESNLGWLQVKTLIHPPSEKPDSCKINTGFIILRKVRQLLKMHLGSSRHTQNSCDGRFTIELNLESMKRDRFWSVWEERENIFPLSVGTLSAAPPLRPGKMTHVFLSHDWGIDDNNHHRVQQISDALRRRGLITWIDDERIINEINLKIVDGIDRAECMLAFITRNYVNKVNGWNYKDYCKKEFIYAYEKLGRDKILLVVLDDSMKDRNAWGGLILYLVGHLLYVDMSQISSLSLDPTESNLIDNLYRRIVPLIEATGTPIESVRTAEEFKTPVEESTARAVVESKKPVEESTTRAVVEVENLVLFIEVSSYHVFLFLLVFTVFYSYLLLQLSFE